MLRSVAWPQFCKRLPPAVLLLVRRNEMIEPAWREAVLLGVALGLFVSVLGLSYCLLLNDARRLWNARWLVVAILLIGCGLGLWAAMLRYKRLTAEPMLPAGPGQGEGAGLVQRPSTLSVRATSGALAVDERRPARRGNRACATARRVGG